jgi:hypothetical protein
MGGRRYSDAQLSDAVRSSHTLRQVLIALGLAPYGGNHETVRERMPPIPLEDLLVEGEVDEHEPAELDHVNGRRDDNRHSNLRLICPNCHALTPTYRGRNIGSTSILR